MAKKSEKNVSLKFDIMTENNLKDALEKGCCMLYLEILESNDEYMLIEENDFPYAKKWIFKD